MRQKNTPSLLLCLLCFAFAASGQPSQHAGNAQIIIDASATGHQLQPSRYGIIFDEINPSEDECNDAELNTTQDISPIYISKNVASINELPHPLTVMVTGKYTQGAPPQYILVIKNDQSNYPPVFYHI